MKKSIATSKKKFSDLFSQNNKGRKGYTTFLTTCFLEEGEGGDEPPSLNRIIEK